MKSLKPIDENTSSTLIASDIADELRTEINALKSANTTLNNQLTELSSKLDSSVISKSKGTFNGLEASTGTITHLDSNSIETESLDATEIDATSVTSSRGSFDSVNTTHISADDGSFTHLDAKEAVIDDLKALKFSADDFTVDKVVTDSVSTNQLNTPSATIDELNVTKLNLNNTINASEINTDTLTTKDFESTAKAIFNEMEAATVTIDKLKTQNQIYCDDENDVKQYVKLDHSSHSDTADDYTFIEIPSVHSGYYRIDVKKDDNKYFAVTCINTEAGPIVHYSRELEGDVEKIYYDVLTRKWYIKSYASGRIYWSNDDKEGNAAPQTFAELPIDESLDTTLHYDCKGKTRLVIMGDHTIDYGLTVQGVLEASMVKEDAAYHQLFFYGNEYNALKKFCERYLVYEDTAGVKHYTESETAGYLFHTADNFKNEDNIETEALEKIAYDGNTITLSIDAKYGQDDIEIDGDDYPSEPGEEVFNQLPFRNMVADYIRNNDLKPGESEFGHPCFVMTDEIFTGIEVSEDFYSETENYAAGSLTDKFGDTHYYNMVLKYIYFNHIDEDGTVRDLEPTEYGLTWTIDDANYIEFEDLGNDPDSWSIRGEEYMNTPSSTYNLRYGGGYHPDSRYLPLPEYKEEEGGSGEPMDNVLPFIISFTLGSYNWDINMNDEVFNSWGVER